MKGFDFMKTKRFLSVLLTLVMAIGLLSSITLTASAEETTTIIEAIWGTSETDLTMGSGTLAEAITAASAENSTVKYIKLQNDINVTSGYEINSGDFTIDFNGKYVKGSGTFKVIRINNSGTKVIFTDSAENIGGIVQTDATSSVGYGLYAANGAEIVIQKGNYTADNTVYIFNSTATVNGGTFESNLNDSQKGSNGNINNIQNIYVNGGECTVYGGTFYSAAKYIFYVKNSSDNIGKLNLKGGTLVSSGTATVGYWGGKVNLSECPNPSDITVYYPNWNGSATISDNVVLPTGYAFYNDDKVATEFEYEKKYIIKQTPLCNIAVENSENGTVTANVTSARYGEEITLTATPSDGYKLMSITVTDEQGNPVAVTNNKFIMPERAVTVAAVFELETEVFYVVLNPVKGTCDVETITVAADGTLSEALPTPTPTDTLTEGYWFKDWYDAPTGGNEVTASTVFIGGATIYAQWDIVNPEIIKYNTLKVDFTFPKAGENIIVIFADYKEWDDPTFVGLKFVPVTTTKTQGEEVMSVNVPSGIELWAGDKIMICENFNTLRPLCEAYKVSGRETPVVDTNPGIDLPIDRN